MLSKNKPPTASSAPNQLLIEVFWRKNSPKIGTSTTYKPVIKPALPAVVPTKPTCCKVAPANKTKPVITAPAQSFEAIFCWFAGFFRKNVVNTNSVKPPNRKRTALNVRGPIKVIPARWATKANPQMAEVSRRIKSAERAVIAGSFLLADMPNHFSKDSIEENEP